MKQHKKLTYWSMAVVMGLLLGVGSWWGTAKLIELNKSDAFVYSDNGMLYWF